MVQILAMDKFWTLCSILFGVWLAMRLERAEARRRPCGSGRNTWRCGLPTACLKLVLELRYRCPTTSVDPSPSCLLETRNDAERDRFQEVLNAKRRYNGDGPISVRRR